MNIPESVEATLQQDLLHPKLVGTEPGSRHHHMGELFLVSLGTITSVLHDTDGVPGQKKKVVLILSFQG